MAQEFVPLEDLLAQMGSPQPYSSEQIDTARSSVDSQTQQASTNAQTVAKQTPTLINISTDSFQKIDKALQQQQELVPKVVEQRKKTQKMTSAMNEQATEQYQRAVMSEDAQKSYQEAKEKLLTAQNAMYEKQDAINNGNVWQRFVARMTLDGTQQELAVAQQNFQNIQRMQVTSANAYATQLEANAAVVQNKTAEERIQLESQQSMIDGIIKTAQDRSKNVSRVIGEYSAALGLDDQATNALVKRVSAMENANAANTQSVLQALQLEHSTMQLRSMKEQSKKSEEAREQYKAMYEGFAESRGMEEGEYVPFDIFMKRSAQENMYDNFTANFLNYTSAQGADSAMQPFTRLNKLVESGAELSPKEQRELQNMGNIVAAHNRGAESRALRAVGLPEDQGPPAPGTQKYDAYQEALKRETINLSNPESYDMVDQLVVSKRKATRKDGGIAIRDGVTKVGRPEDAMKSPSFREKFLSKLPPALRADVENGNIPENLEIDTTNYESKTNDVAASTIDSIIEAVEAAGAGDWKTQMPEVERRIEQEAQKIGAYYSAQEETIKAENPFVGDLKLPDTNSTNSNIGTASSKIDITSSGDWQVKLKQRLMQLRLKSLPQNTSADQFRATQAQRQLGNN
jgi:hypothetical protein